MELEEVIERLEKLLKLRLNKANEIKYDNCIIATEDLQIILKYIKEESISKAKIRDVQRLIEFGLQQEYKEFEKNSIWLTLQSLLNKGE